MPRVFQGPTAPCAECGAVVRLTKQRVNNSKSGRFFCGNACNGRYNARHGLAKPPKTKAREGTYTDAPCAWCGTVLHREVVAHGKKGRSYGHFCNHECYGKWRSENLSGENSPQWKGGTSLDYGRSRWKAQRRKARERDGHRCQDCGVTEQSWGYALDVHHIIPFDTFEDPFEANQLENLVTLCRTCHAARHKEPLED